jgi:hypothetical protein
LFEVVGTKINLRQDHGGIYIAGIPPVLSEEELLARRWEAHLLIQDKRSRSTAPAAQPLNSAATFNYSTDSDIAVMKEKFPFLQGFSNTFLRANKPESLLKMEATSLKMKELERSKDAEEKLAANRAALSTSSITIKEGKDDRWSTLHQGRFLPGVGCSAVQIWLTARETIASQDRLHLAITTWPPWAWVAS